MIISLFSGKMYFGSKYMYFGSKYLKSKNEYFSKKIEVLLSFLSCTVLRSTVQYSIREVFRFFFDNEITRIQEVSWDVSRTTRRRL